MSNHWPIFLAVILLGVAGWFGWDQQNKLQESVKTQASVKMLPVHYDPNGPATTAKGPAEKAPAMATVPPVSRSVPLPVVSVPPPVMKADPAANRNQVPNPNPAANQNLGLNPNQGQGAAERDTVFMTLSAALQQKFNTAPMITNNGYAFVVDGARIDVDATQAWMVTIFNNTKAQPPEHTENFKTIEGLVSAALEYDQKTATPRTTPDQKTVWRPMSKLGKVAIEMDPAMFNSVTIKPLQRPQNFVQPQQNPGNGVNPGKPVMVQPVQPKQPFPPPPVVKQTMPPAIPAAPNPPAVKQPVKQPAAPTPPPPVNPVQDQF